MDNFKRVTKHRNGNQRYADPDAYYTASGHFSGTNQASIDVRFNQEGRVINDQAFSEPSKTAKRGEQLINSEGRVHSISRDWLN